MGGEVVCFVSYLFGFFVRGVFWGLFRWEGKSDPRSSILAKTVTCFDVTAFLAFCVRP